LSSSQIRYKSARAIAMVTESAIPACATASQDSTAWTAPKVSERRTHTKKPALWPFLCRPIRTRRRPEVEPRRPTMSGSSSSPTSHLGQTAAMNSLVTSACNYSSRHRRSAAPLTALSGAPVTSVGLQRWFSNCGEPL